MEQLIEKYRSLLSQVKTTFVRSKYDQINWDSRGIAILGGRGTGKSTLMLQYIKKSLPLDKTIYFSMDDLFFTENTLSDVVDQFYKLGGRYLFLDEVHKYPTWQQEVKNFYDFYIDLKIVVSGSSVLALQKAQADLSRRLVFYTLNELSLREYISLTEKRSLSYYSLQDVLSHHTVLSQDLEEQLKSPLLWFNDYSAFGSYPFVVEGKGDYQVKINQLINVIIDYDLPEMQAVTTTTLHKIKRLLFIISRSVPFIPNVSKLAKQLETSRNNVLEYFYILEQAKLIYALRSSTKGVSLLNKPEKLYLRNPNLIHALSQESPNVGNLRETFFMNQIEAAGNRVSYSSKGDFLVNDTLTFEVGGKDKGFNQIQDVEQSFVASDGIVHGFAQKIPLWLFGFLY